MTKCIASILCFVLGGCAAQQQQTVDCRSHSRIRAAGPNLDRQYDWGSHVVAQGGHAMD
jgi:hypothetical protein